MAKLKVGDLVRNYGFTARVIRFHEETGDPILRDVKDGTRWLAHADLCERIASIAESNPAYDYQFPSERSAK